MSPWPGSGNEAAARIEPARLDGFDGGPRFGVWWLPAGHEPRGTVLCVQPLGEERAAARHALAAQAWRLSAGGWAVLMIDLYGTGDSPGEPAGITLQRWRGDLLRAAMLARQRHAGPNVLWGVRGGALLAADIAVALDQLVDAYVFWQPSGDERIPPEPGGEGGSLPSTLLDELHELRMQPPALADHGGVPAALFVEMREAREGVPAGASALICDLTEAWLEAGYLALPQRVNAAPFWQPCGAAGGGSAAPHAAALPTAAFAATEEFLESVR